MPEKRSQRPRGPARAIEDVFIILCILTLWPVVLRWHHPAFQYLMYGALVGLAIIFVRRIRRFTDARRDMNR